MELVLNITQTDISGGFFQEDRPIGAFSYPCEPFPEQTLSTFLKDKQPSAILISSVNKKVESTAIALLEKHKLPFKLLDFSQLKIILDVTKPQAVSHDQIANAYGALKHFPLNDCIVVDIDTALTCDLISKDGHYLGGMMCPGPYCDPLTRPESPLGKTAEESLQGGIYFGLLGAIERLVDELRATAESPSSIRVIATGRFARDGMVEDLEELVDLIDPYLTLVGLHEIQNG